MARTIFTANEDSDDKGSGDDLNLTIEDNPGIATLFGPIDTDIAKEICHWIIAENFQEDKAEVLTLLINSIGGDLHAGFAIIETMMSSKIPVRTIAMGEVMSCGLIIAMSGTPGQRLITPSCSVMSHNFNTGIEGSYDQLKDIRTELDRVNHKIISHYKLCTGLTESVIKKKLVTPKDIYMNPEEAVKMNLFDRVDTLRVLYE